MHAFGASVGLRIREHAADIPVNGSRHWSCSSPPGTVLCAFSGSLGTRFFFAGPKCGPGVGTPFRIGLKHWPVAAENGTVKLVAFDPQYLRVGVPLPFGLRDAGGRLLVASGQKIANDEALDELLGARLFTTESEAQEWQRRLAAAMDAKLRAGASLKDVAAARPEDARRAAAASKLGLVEQWEEFAVRHDSLAGGFASAADALARLRSIHDEARETGRRRPDGSLYYLVYQAAASTERYGSHHALLSLLICEAAAAVLEATPAEVDALGLAAIAMNLGMHRLQNLLAQSQLPVTPEMRGEIDRHAHHSAELLRAAGLDDPLTLELVRCHHDRGAADEDWAQLSPGTRLARLLRRVDIFAAKISRRATRMPMSPLQAAREACLDPRTGQPDAIGAALLKAVGLFPPGSFVELASGELGIVIARGRRANVPFVAALVAASGNVMAEPALRDTLDRRHAIKGSVDAGRVRVHPPHEKLIAMR